MYNKQYITITKEADLSMLKQYLKVKQIIFILVTFCLFTMFNISYAAYTTCQCKQNYNDQAFQVASYLAYHLTCTYSDGASYSESGNPDAKVVAPAPNNVPPKTSWPSSPLPYDTCNSSSSSDCAVYVQGLKNTCANAGLQPRN